MHITAYCTIGGIRESELLLSNIEESAQGYFI